jgi:hypothetical protein
MVIIRCGTRFFNGFTWKHPGDQKEGHIEPRFSVDQAHLISDHEITSCVANLARFTAEIEILNVGKRDL